MKYIKLLLLLTIGISGIVNGQELKKQEDVCYNPNLLKDTTKKSIKSMAVGIIGTDTVKISYHSPGVRGRIIWGGLVPFDEVWVTGAHDATTLTIKQAFEIGGKEIPAGKYALFTIPGRESSTVILNKHWNQHLANEYDQKDDVVRFQVTPMDNTHTERLQYFVEPVKDNEGMISIAWDKVRVEFPIRIIKR